MSTNPNFLRWGLVFTHFFWGLSLLFDPITYLRLPFPPTAYASVHLVAFLLLLRYQKIGAFLSFLLLLWYWLFVKPLAPIAEPQSVGLLAPSLVLTLYGPWASISRKFHPTLGRMDDFALLALRLGIAYPFLEWGLDALRNPAVFYSYLQENRLAFGIIEPFGLEKATFFLGSFEVILSILLVVGFGGRWSPMAALASLVVFLAVAGYPLAFPQDIALAASTIHILGGRGKISLDWLTKSLYEGKK